MHENCKASLKLSKGQMQLWHESFYKALSLHIYNSLAPCFESKAVDWIQTTSRLLCFLCYKYTPLQCFKLGVHGNGFQCHSCSPVTCELFYIFSLRVSCRESFSRESLKSESSNLTCLCSQTLSNKYKATKNLSNRCGRFAASWREITYLFFVNKQNNLLIHKLLEAQGIEQQCFSSFNMKLIIQKAKAPSTAVNVHCFVFDTK